MLTLRTVLTSTALAIAAALALGTSAAAQDMDGRWLKVVASSKGYSIDSTDGEISKGKLKVTSYWLFTPFIPADGGIPVQAYDIDVVTEIAPGEFAFTYFAEEAIIEGANEDILTDLYMEFSTFDGLWFGGYGTSRLIIKKDKQGNVKSVKFKSLGAEVTEGTLTPAPEMDGPPPTEDLYRGGYTLKGKLIPESKLPFTVKVKASAPPAAESGSVIRPAIRKQR